MSHFQRYGLLLVAVAAAPAWAANLDKALLDGAPGLLAALKKADVKSVGVLPFAVGRGERPAGFDTAPLAAGMPGRLENALILRQTSQERGAIKVLRDVTGAAGRAGVGAWRKDPAAFKKLFETKYEVAWGTDWLKAEALLTGEVRLTGDRKTAEVVVRVVKPGAWKDGKAALTDLGTFTVKTDRSLLRDVGYNAVVSRALVQKKERLSGDKLDEDAVDRVTAEEKGEKAAPGPTSPESHSPAAVGGMRFEVEYDGVKQEIRSEAGPEGARQPAYTLPAPRPGQKVVMYLTRTEAGEGKLGVVLRVNGKSTWKQEDADPASCTRWTFGPETAGTRDAVAGYYEKDAAGKLVCYEWKSLDETAAAARASEMGNRVGWIDLDVFAERPDGAGADDGLIVSTRSMVRKKPATLGELRKGLAKANYVRLSPVAPRSLGGLLVGDVDPAPAGEIATDALKNPVRVGGISVRYLAATGGKTVDE